MMTALKVQSATLEPMIVLALLQPALPEALLEALPAHQRLLLPLEVPQQHQRRPLQHHHPPDLQLEAQQAPQQPLRLVHLHPHQLLILKILLLHRNLLSQLARPLRWISYWIDIQKTMDMIGCKSPQIHKPLLQSQPMQLLAKEMTTKLHLLIK